MKIFGSFLVFAFLLAGKIFSQDTTVKVFHLDSLPAQGVLLNKYWKFHEGDSLSWANPGYNDSSWQSINLLLPLYRLPEIKQPGIGWLRLRLKVDSSLQNKTVSIVFTFGGAAELYLDGRLIYHFGKVSTNYKEEQTNLFFGRPFSLKLGNDSIQCIAIRYSLNPRNLYINFGNHPYMKVVLKDINIAFTDYNKVEGGYRIRNSIQLSIYLPLGLLLLFLFLAFRMQKEYLHFGVFCLCMFFGRLLYIVGLGASVTVTFSNVMVLASFVFLILGAMLFLNGTYVLHKQRKRWIFYMLLVYGLLIIPALLFIHEWGYLFYSFFFPLAILDFLRLNIQASRRGRQGAWILAITGIIFFILIICSIFLGVAGKRELSDLLVAISFIIPSIGLSLFVAGEFARTGFSLQQRIKEVENLSEKTIRQEKEKQQILTAQNETLEKQVNERTAALKQSLEELKSTQSQLIQSEKMASLGELTAGIAHEIQNPLNFVNNFSEVNTELIDELGQEADKGNLDEVKAIAKDIKENEQKINHHGKRADAIVKGMLQHSRTSSGQKEPTDINALCDEYLRLAYHGLRAKDKSFNAKFETDFDNSIGKINIIPQDIGRVMLNLINNAFYAVAEKNASTSSAGQPYEPTVSVSTKKANGKVEIRVADNGNGIPQKVLEKIFQPFFTTKPTGQGTGLGLSLAYDIVKAHGGELKVETKEGEGSEFTVQLPLSKNE
jgi:signal transduction histidine kinase